MIKLSLLIILLSTSLTYGGHNLVNIAKDYPDLMLNIRYATKNNCVQESIYSSAFCYLHHDVAESLHNAQVELMTKHSLKLIIFDAYQPKSVREALWQLLPNDLYITDPIQHDDHERGCAVDISLITIEGNSIDMGTDFDCLTVKSKRSYTDLSPEILSHRRLLDEIMRKHGFIAPQEESWWHYIYQNSEEYPVLSCEFEELD